MGALAFPSKIKADNPDSGRSHFDSENTQDPSF